MLQESSSTWDGPQGISFLWPVSGYKIFGEADRENLRKKLHWLERWTSEVVSIVLLIPDFNIPAPGYTPWLIK